MERIDPGSTKSARLTPEQEAKVVITLGDAKITAKEFMVYADSLPASSRELARNVNRGTFADHLIKTRLLAQEARRRKYHEDPAIQLQMQFYQDAMLAARLQEAESQQVAVDDAKVLDYYERNKEQYQRIRTRHILIRFEGSAVPVQEGRKDLSSDEALAKIQELRERIEAGEDFAELAKAESDDKNSAVNGGDLGFVRRGQLLPQFEEVVFSLKAGELSEPVRTPYGFHLIRTEDRELKPADDLKDELERRLRRELADARLRAIVEQTPVTVDESFFGMDAVPAARPLKPADPQPVIAPEGTPPLSP